jgi:molybdopterin synthase sulfur carrier subunit
VNRREAAVRVVLPAHLCTLAKVSGEVVLSVREPVTLAAVLEALEARHPVLRGTIRDGHTGRRRPFVRFFASRQDISHAEPGTALPLAVARGAEPLLVIGAIAGG